MNIQRAKELQEKGYEQLPMRMFHQETTKSLAVDHQTRTFYVVSEEGKNFILKTIKNQIK